MWDDTDRSQTCHAEAELNALRPDNSSPRKENPPLAEHTDDEHTFSDPQMSFMVHAARDAILTMDAAGRITSFDRAAEATFGWRAGEAVGRDFCDLVAPGLHQEAWSRSLAHFAHEGKEPAFGETLELTAVHRDGAEFPAEVSLSIMEIENRRHIVGMIRDITGRRQAETAHRQNEKQLRNILDSIIAGVLIIDTQTHTIADINDSGAAMVGLPREEIIGKSCHTLIRPDTQHQRPIADQKHTVDDILIKADKTTLPILKTVRRGTFRGRPCMIESFVPIAEQKQIERELKESLALTQATLDASVGGILVVDEDNRIKMFNNRFVELMHASIDILESGDDMALRAEIMARTKHPEQLETALAEIGKHPDQDRLDLVEFIDGTVIEQLCRPCILGNRVVGRVFSIRDITERFNAQKKQDALMRQVAAVNEELTHFAYVVSHDLKAPLRGIKLLTEWLCADYADQLGEEAAEQLDLLQSRVQRMHNLIEGVLQYSRIGRIKQQATTIDLNDLLDNIVDDIAPPDHIQVTVQKPLPTVTGERTRITQVFQNLLSNAVKYMDKPEGQITIACDDGPDAWTFSVTDNGPGIEAKYFERIFQIFQTLAPKDEYESTGVGLTLVRKIVEYHGGRVWVESEIGRGSRFSFTFPKNSIENSDATSTTQTPGAGETLTPRRSLCK